MKCMVIKASPRGAKSSSSRLADAFIDGLKSTGVEVSEVILREKEIKHCTGCYTCWTKTPGRCIHRDDMDTLLPEFDNADLIVYATPLYYFSVPGQLKDFMDRGLPLLKPFLVKKGERTGHPRINEKNRKFVLISTAGFPEKSVFSPLESLFETEIENSEENIVGKIFIGGAEIMSQDQSQDLYKDLYNFVTEAGKEVGRGESISKATEEKIDSFQKAFIKSPEEFGEIANAYWNSLRPDDASFEGSPSHTTKDISSEKGDKQCSLSKGGMESFMAGMAMTYNKSDKDLKAIMQFNFEGEGFYLTISENKCEAYRGFHKNPTFTVISPADVWEDISEGRISGQEGLFKGLYKIEGDMTLFMKMDSFFSSNDNESEEDKVLDPDIEKIKKGRGPIKLSGSTWMVIAFLPWMILWIAPHITSTPWVAYGAAALSTLICLYHLISGKVTFFEGGTFVFMAIGAIFARFPHPIFTKGFDFFQYIFLAGLWAGSLTRKFSLTGEYIRNGFPKSVWMRPSFRETNKILTATWALYYCVAALIRYIETLIDSSLATTDGLVLALTITPYILLGPMFTFTAVFSRLYPVKLMKKEAAVE